MVLRDDNNSQVLIHKYNKVYTVLFVLPLPSSFLLWAHSERLHPILTIVNPRNVYTYPQNPHKGTSTNQQVDSDGFAMVLKQHLSIAAISYVVVVVFLERGRGGGGGATGDENRNDTKQANIISQNFAHAHMINKYCYQGRGSHKSQCTLTQVTVHSQFTNLQK